LCQILKGLEEKVVKRYKEAGVDIEKGERFIDLIAPMIKSTFHPEVKNNIGGYAGLFSIYSYAERFKHPILVASTDGVGTKLKLAFMMGKHNTIGIDLVAMCVNDVVVTGAKPLFFLDYFATSQLEPSDAKKVIEGIVDGCKESECSLIGGETAEMPDFYNKGEYDLAGFCVGIVDEEKIIDGSSISVGDKIVGLASSGLHSNGYSLARKIIFEELGLKIDDKIEGFELTIGEELLKPTRIYVNSILNIIRDFDILGISHITGGGIYRNLSRILPKECKAIIYTKNWDIPPIFTFIEEKGKLDFKDMISIFNYGIGIILVVKSDQLNDLIQRINALGEKGFVIGEVVKKEDGDKALEFR